MRRVTGQLRTFSNAGPQGWGQFVRTFLISFLIERSLNREQLDATARRFGATLSFDPPVQLAERLPITAAEGVRLRVALAVLRRTPVNGTCLRRALVIADVVRDHHPILRVGVAKPAGRVEAHAWVEICGIAIDPMLDRQFTPLRSPRSLE